MMKKLILSLATIALVVTGIFTFTGCEKEESTIPSISYQQGKIVKALDITKKIVIPPNTCVTDANGEVWEISGYLVVGVTFSPFNIGIIRGDITIENKTTGQKIHFVYTVLRNNDGNEVGFDVEEGEIENDLLSFIHNFFNNNLYSWPLEDL